MLNIAENTAEYLRPAIDDIFKLYLEVSLMRCFCILVLIILFNRLWKKKDEFEAPRRDLALEILITLSETASEMVRKVKKQYLLCWPDGEHWSWL